MECTLILTKGDSGKCMVVAGIESIGRDKYGMFALKGTLVVRKLTIEKIPLSHKR